MSAAIGRGSYHGRMQPVLTAAASHALDATATEAVDVLMDRAGLAVALAAVDMGARYGTRVTVLAGPGNNGGDGYVAAAYLADRGVAVTVLEAHPPKTPACQAAAARARRRGVRVVSETSPGADDVVVIDALFGAGFRGELDDRWDPWLTQPVPVLAVDVPTGLDATTGEAGRRHVRASRTVTFHAHKVGHFVGAGPSVCGQIDVVDIGLDGGEAAFWLADAADAPRPARPVDGHKWSVGSVMVVGGAPGMTGAAWLAGSAALRFGAGSVAIGTNALTAATYAALAPHLLTPSVGTSAGWHPGDGELITKASERFDVLVVGPGLGPAADLVEAVVEQRTGSLVLDADAITGIDIDLLQRRRGPTVLTPHAGEFLRLTGQEASYESAAMLAERTGAVVCLKGPTTFVASPGAPVVGIATGGPELATIGTGDVLTGMIAALWARGLAPARAAVSGAFWHGRAGTELGRTRTVTAELLADEVGRWAT